MEISVEVPQIAKVEMSNVLALVLLGIYSKDPMLYNIYTCIFMFIVVLFITVRELNKPKCISTDKWSMKNTVHIYNVQNKILFSSKEE